MDEHTSSGCAAIHVASTMGNLEALRVLLMTLATSLSFGDEKENPSKVLDIRDASGWTPLHHSIRNRQTETMRWLLQQGADYHISTFPVAHWYPVARWYPEGHDGEAFRPIDVARLAGEDMVNQFVLALREVSPDAMESDGDIFWDSPEGSIKSEENDATTEDAPADEMQVQEKSFV